MIEVAQDYPALRQYAAEEFRFMAKRRVAGPHADLVDPPEIPAAYRAWLEFLLMVESRGSGPTVRTASDVARGLDILGAALEEVMREYRSCPACGALLPRAAHGCLCGEKFK